jgi:flagellar biosynthetic protein FliR
LTYAQWAAFVLVLLRCGSLIVTLPFFGSANLPPMIKAGLCMSLALLISPLVPPGAFRLPATMLGFVLLAAGEMMLGAILGLTVRLLMTSVQIMGQLVGFQMGFAVANVLDPVTGGQVSVLAQFCFLMAILVLFAVGGDHWFFKALADSFLLVRPGDISLSPSLFKQMVHISGEMFSLSIRLGAPVIGALLFTQVSMGILAKTVPQMNILMVGFPLTVSVGLIFLYLTMRLMIPTLAGVFRDLGPTLAGLLKAM